MTKEKKNCTMEKTNRRIITWKPDLMLATEHREPHVSHCKKNSLVSFWRIVSGERQVWHVTYSLIYLLKTFSICFCWKRPLIMSWLLPSTEPLVPNSASRKSNKCFGCRCSVLHICNYTNGLYTGCRSKSEPIRVKTLIKFRQRM